ncbi:hypothetical protein [Candidatus Laterigemmans baculatus]|uniref:hypothetical protein n=1 Tax=Candidatus Laterigemmans baculatus TaxID=2770505 RepID=UPI0013DBDEBE|nr:hypothetical protein [Candidatus Laterigemmans baculatus]
MSHYAYWSLHRMPFGRPELADDFFAGRPQREALARLDYLISGGRSSGLLIAPAGAGRTMLLHRIAVSAGFGDTAVDMVRTGARNRSAEELLVHLAQRLGVTHLGVTHFGSGRLGSGRLGDVYRQVSERIAASARQSVRTVWLLDDATTLAAETAGALAAETPWFTAVIGCSPHDALSLAAAVGGCPLRIDLDPFDLADTAGYIRHALAQAGAREEVFKDAAIVRLHELAEGRVGTIARLADLALLAGAGEQAKQISAELVEAVQYEVMPAAA